MQARVHTPLRPLAQCTAQTTTTAHTKLSPHLQDTSVSFNSFNGWQLEKVRVRMNIYTMQEIYCIVNILILIHTFSTFDAIYMVHFTITIYFDFQMMSCSWKKHISAFLLKVFVFYYSWWKSCWICWNPKSRYRIPGLPLTWIRLCFSISSGLVQPNDTWSSFPVQSSDTGSRYGLLCFSYIQIFSQSESFLIICFCQYNYHNYYDNDYNCNYLW